MKDLKSFQEESPTGDWPEHWVVAHRMLQPIEWNWSSSIGSRKSLVTSKREKVKNVLPFTSGVMRKFMLQWLEEEKHLGLWE